MQFGENIKRVPLDILAIRHNTRHMPSLESPNQKTKSFTTKADFHQLFINITNTVSLLQDARNREYLLIQNQSLGDMYLGFGVQPNIGNGVKITSNGFYELFNCVPQNDIFIISSIAIAGGILVWGD